MNCLPEKVRNCRCANFTQTDRESTENVGNIRAKLALKGTALETIDGILIQNASTSLINSGYLKRLQWAVKGLNRLQIF
jgi:hypothetical protein